MVYLYEYSNNTYGVMISMFGIHRSDRGSNPGWGGEIS